MRFYSQGILQALNEQIKGVEWLRVFCVSMSWRLDPFLNSLALQPFWYPPKIMDSKGFVKGSLGGETSVLRTFRMSGKELVKERVSEGKS